MTETHFVIKGDKAFGVVRIEKNQSDNLNNLNFPAWDAAYSVTYYDASCCGYYGFICRASYPRN